MPIQFYNNSILFVNNKIALDPNCCCGGYCLLGWKVTWDCDCDGFTTNGQTPSCIIKSDTEWGKVGYPPYLTVVWRLADEWLEASSKVEEIKINSTNDIEIVEAASATSEIKIKFQYFTQCNCTVSEWVHYADIVKGDPPTLDYNIEWWIDRGTMGVCNTGFEFFDLRSPLSYGEIPYITQSCNNYNKAEDDDWDDNIGGNPYVTRPTLNPPSKNAQGNIPDDYNKTFFCTPTLKVLFNYTGTLNAANAPNWWYDPGHLWQDGECMIYGPKGYTLGCGNVSCGEIAHFINEGGDWVFYFSAERWTSCFYSPTLDTSFCSTGVTGTHAFFNNGFTDYGNLWVHWYSDYTRFSPTGPWFGSHGDVANDEDSYDIDIPNLRNESCPFCAPNSGSITTSHSDYITGGTLTISWEPIGPWCNCA